MKAECEVHYFDNDFMSMSKDMFDDEIDLIKDGGNNE